MSVKNSFLLTILTVSLDSADNFIKKKKFMKKMFLMKNIGVKSENMKY